VIKTGAAVDGDRSDIRPGFEASDAQGREIYMRASCALFLLFYQGEIRYPQLARHAKLPRLAKRFILQP